MEEESISYEMLQDLLRTERRGNKPTPLPPRFWPEVRTFLEEITAHFRTEQAKDPFSRKVMLLTDEVKNARHAAQALWALRERKLAMLALAHTHERQRPQGITADEGALYDRLLEVLDGARQEVLGPATREAAPRGSAAPKAPGAGPRGTPAGPNGQAGPETSEPGPPVPAEQAVEGERPVEAEQAVEGERPVEAEQTVEGERPVEAEQTVEATPEVVPEPARTASGPPSPAPSEVPSDVAGEGAAVTIRALGDIPPFVGPDMQTYVLKEGDLATVPPSIAQLLERRRKAVVVEA